MPNILFDKVKILSKRLVNGGRALRGYLHSLLKHEIYYVYDGINWSLFWDGHYIVSNIKNRIGINSYLVKETRFLYNQVIHFGDAFIMMRDWSKHLHRSNRIVVSFFHGSREDSKFTDLIDGFIRCQNQVNSIIVTCDIVYSRLRNYGLRQDKLVKIPLGVDLDIFAPPAYNTKEQRRRYLGIKPEQIVIGSFQKDGVGWGEGMEPKLIKGPDIFLQVVERLARRFPVYVLLTGPSRGYIKNGLRRLNIPYGHFYIKHYPDVVSYYHALDLYLVTSRDEGGPKAVLECMATGVPLVSTRVGMAADLIKQGENGFLNETNDDEGMANNSRRLIEDLKLRQLFVKNGFETVKDYGWENIAMQYYEKAYSPLL